MLLVAELFVIIDVRPLDMLTGIAHGILKQALLIANVRKKKEASGIFNFKKTYKYKNTYSGQVKNIEEYISSDVFTI